MAIRSRSQGSGRVEETSENVKADPIWLAMTNCLTLNVTEGGLEKGSLTHNSMLPNIGIPKEG